MKSFIITIHSKRISDPDELSFSLIDSDEVNHLYDLILSGEASRNDLEESQNSNILFNALNKVLTTIKLFSSINSISYEASKFKSSIQRFLASYLYTMECIIEASSTAAAEESTNLKTVTNTKNISFIMSSIQLCFAQTDSATTLNNNQAVSLLLEEYKDIFSYSYTFGRKVGKYPQSALPAVQQHLNQLQLQQGGAANKSYKNMHDLDTNFDDDEDDVEEFDHPDSTDPSPLKATNRKSAHSSDRQLNTTNSLEHSTDSIDNILSYMPSISTPSIAPLNPFNSSPTALAIQTNSNSNSNGNSINVKSNVNNKVGGARNPLDDEDEEDAGEILLMKLFVCPFMSRQFQFECLYFSCEDS